MYLFYKLSVVREIDIRRLGIKLSPFAFTDATSFFILVLFGEMVWIDAWGEKLY